MKNIYIYIITIISFFNLDCIAQSRFTVSVGTGLNLSIVNLDKRVLTFGQSHEINSKFGILLFLNSKIRLSKRVSLNTRITYFTSQLEYIFTDLIDPTEGFEDYSKWDVSSAIKEKGVSLSPGISYYLSDKVFVDAYFSYTRIFSSDTESNYTTVEVPFEVSDTESSSTEYNQISSLYQIGLDVKKLTFTLSAEVFYREREIFFPLNFREPKGNEVKFMFGVAYNF